MYDILDSHCHIYPDGIARKAVAAVDRFYDNLPADHFDGTVASLLASGDAHGIRRFLVHSVATTPHQVSSINRFIAQSAASSGGRFIGFGALHPDSPTLREDFEALRALGLRGVKLHPDVQRFPVDDPRAMALFEMCEAAGLPVLVHTGDARYDYSNPNRVRRVLAAFPHLKFIGAHFGGWSVWDDAARILTAYDNIVVDSSSTFYALPPEKAAALVRAWTPRRILFGTDYPMWPPARDIEALLRMNLTDDDYEDIFHRNSERLLHL